MSSDTGTPFKASLNSLMSFSQFANHESYNPTTHGLQQIDRFHDALPDELRLKIVEACGAPTLWQLRQTCRFMLKEAGERFWAAQDAYYQVDTRRLVDDTIEDHCIPEFARQVQRIEFDWRITTRSFELDDPVTTPSSTWSLIRTWFPNMRHVIFTMSVFETLSSREIIQFREIVEAAPEQVEVSLAKVDESVDGVLYRTQRTGQEVEVLTPVSWTWYRVREPGCGEECSAWESIPNPSGRAA